MFHGSLASAPSILFSTPPYPRTKPRCQTRGLETTSLDLCRPHVDEELGLYASCQHRACSPCSRTLTSPDRRRLHNPPRSTLGRLVGLLLTPWLVQCNSSVRGCWQPSAPPRSPRADIQYFVQSISTRNTTRPGLSVTAHSPGRCVFCKDHRGNSSRCAGDLGRIATTVFDPSATTPLPFSGVERVSILIETFPKLGALRPWFHNRSPTWLCGKPRMRMAG